MGKILLHLTFVVLPHDKKDRVRITEYKENYTILLYDQGLNLIPIMVTPKIHMEYTNHLSAGFQCDFIIQTTPDIQLKPKKNPDKPYLVDCSSCIKNNHSFLVIYFENGYQMWTDCPFYFLYQKMSEYMAHHINKCCKESDYLFMNYEKHDWYFNQLSYSIIDEDLKILYSRML